jgi:hypothetical protein
MGARFGNWLTAQQARMLWQLPDASTLKGKRDRAILLFCWDAVYDDVN